jgi:sodium bicarbonate cotransporter 5
MPVDFVSKTKLVFLRLEAAIEIPSLLEVRLRSRFIAIIVGPASKHLQLYEVGRALATCLADDVCRELFYSAKCREDMLGVVDQFNRGTMVIPPGEWNPKIRIEPPVKYMSKEERKKVSELAEYIHVEESIGGHDHADPTLKGSRK